MQYRILYFFHGRNVAILAHSLTKEDEIPAVDIAVFRGGRPDGKRKPAAAEFDRINAGLAGTAAGPSLLRARGIAAVKLKRE